MPLVLGRNPARSLGWASLVPAIILFDLLFVPRITFFVSIPASVLLVGLLVAKNGIKPVHFVLLLFLSLILIASVIFGLNVTVGGQGEENAKRAAQVISILLYAVCRFKKPISMGALIIVLRVFFVVLLAAVVCFYLEPSVYSSVIYGLYPEASGMIEENLLFQRFPYVFTDPNSAGYLVCMALGLYLIIEKNGKLAAIGSAFAVFAIIATQSRGAYLALIVTFVLFFAFGKRSRSAKFLFAILLFSSAVALGYLYKDTLDDVAVASETRFDSEDELGGGRLAKYAYFAENINILPFGVGYYLSKDGAEFRPHSDFIRINLSYGFFALFLVLYFSFPRHRSQWALFFSFLVPFFINSAIDDYRLWAFYLLAMNLAYESKKDALS